MGNILDSIRLHDRCKCDVCQQIVRELEQQVMAQDERTRAFLHRGRASFASRDEVDTTPTELTLDDINRVMRRYDEEKEDRTRRGPKQVEAGGSRQHSTECDAET